ncbi:phage repressor protein [[Clostridium] innocuum]|nr:phage repressor protein [[Clostridium] innocuum]
MRIEEWNGYKIRFVEKDGEWWAVGKDVCKALGLKQPTRALRTLKGVTKCKVLTDGGYQELNIIDVKSIYKLAFKSRKKEAEDFKDWVVDVIDKLREASGLEGFQVFRMLDKEHQKEMMKKLNNNIENPKQKHFIKANTIANKAVSNKHGYSKMLKKGSMSPQMLVDREPILEDTVELMSVNEKFGLGISVSKAVYQKYSS